MKNFVVRIQAPEDQLTKYVNPDQFQLNVYSTIVNTCDNIFEVLDHVKDFCRVNNIRPDSVTILTDQR